MNKKTINNSLCEIIKKLQEKKAKIFYNLKSLERITTKKARALKYDMARVKIKYKDSEHLLFKKGRDWNIHFTLIHEFLPKYKGKRESIYAEKWATHFSWNLKKSYDYKYHNKLVELIKSDLGKYKIGFCIEKDERGYYHVHGISDASTNKVLSSVKKILCQFLDNKEKRIKVNEIQNKYCYIAYMKKQGEIKFI
ncbi:hypothetical protein [Flavobacterium lacisediminis]|uniref:Inovirus Gp2 family protein n=1 Tax=Flavobacterium lacisediminis TaxID=2989705 RepID=A0ABT3EHI1_9FLAO|nr:hypothetical protein [Flavobacterium lacisediminis]MCW1148035.1 hypothetical protein [Flavobacterium lacisediminis]